MCRCAFPSLLFFWPQPHPIYIPIIASVVSLLGIINLLYAETIVLDVNKSTNTCDIHIKRIIGGRSTRIDINDIEDIVIETYVVQKTSAEGIGTPYVCLALDTGARVPILQRQASSNSQKAATEAHNQSIQFAKTIAEFLDKEELVHEKHDGVFGMIQRMRQIKRPDRAIQNTSTETPMDVMRESLEIIPPQTVDPAALDPDLAGHIEIVRKPKSMWIVGGLFIAGGSLVFLLDFLVGNPSLEVLLFGSAFFVPGVLIILFGARTLYLNINRNTQQLTMTRKGMINTKIEEISLNNIAKVYLDVARRRSSSSSSSSTYYVYTARLELIDHRFIRVDEGRNRQEQYNLAQTIAKMVGRGDVVIDEGKFGESVKALKDMWKAYKST